VNIKIISLHTLSTRSLDIDNKRLIFIFFQAARKLRMDQNFAM